MGRFGVILGSLEAVLGRPETIGRQAKQAQQANQSKTSKHVEQAEHAEQRVQTEQAELVGRWGGIIVLGMSWHSGGGCV